MICHGIMASTKSRMPEYAVPLSEIFQVSRQQKQKPKRKKRKKKLTTDKNAICYYDIRTPTCPAHIRMPRLFQRCAADPEKHGGHTKQEIHGHNGEPDEDSSSAVNPIRDEQQRNGERRLTPGLAADGQRYGNLSDQVHVVEVAEG